MLNPMRANHSFPLQVIEAMLRAPSADNSQPFHFTLTGAGLEVAYDHRRVAGATFAPLDPATLLALGACIENVQQVATAAGITAPFRAGTALEGDPAGSYGRFVLDATPAVAAIPNDHPVFRRHTNRFAYRTIPLPGNLLDWTRGQREERARIRLLETRDEIRATASLVREASKIRFRTREVHEWLGQSLRFDQEEVAKGDGLDVKTLDLPPGGALFLKLIADWQRMARLNRVGVYRLLSRIDAAPVAKAPALVAIHAPATPSGAVSAGQLMQRLWIRLNQEGVAAHPYYVIPDQLVRLAEGRIPEALVGEAQALSRGVAHLFGDGAETELRMLLRVGYPRREAPRSRRLPLEQMFTDARPGRDD